MSSGIASLNKEQVEVRLAIFGDARDCLTDADYRRIDELLDRKLVLQQQEILAVLEGALLGRLYNYSAKHRRQYGL